MIYQQPVNDPLTYYYYNNSFSSLEIKKILVALENLEYENAQIVSENNNNVRKGKLKWIPKNENWTWVYKRMMEIALEANQKLWHFDIFQCEYIQYTEYDEKDEGHYNWHQDVSSGIYSHRKISISIQLSDPGSYSGGDLQFWLGGETNVISVQKALGEATIFPSYMMHRVTKVHSGTRKSLVLWIGGSHFR